MTVRIAPEQNADIQIETVRENKDLRQLVTDEKFMNELLVINISPGQTEGDPPCVVLNVNGINQPVWRGEDTPVKRKYVEVLARMKQTSFSQRPQDMTNPERSNELLPRTFLVYPFHVVKDPNPKGPPWLQAIKAERA